jgi:TetR/AcrR family transcriptional repressor of nem operon
LCTDVHNQPVTRELKEVPGRPREFDRDAALAKAMDVFWQHGFSKTTYAALEKATGLHRQSLVYAFGDKKALFHAVLQYYAMTRVQTAINQLQAPGSPLANIRGVFEAWLNDARRESTPGCLFVNTSGELGQAEPAFAQVIEQSTQQLVQAFERAIGAGQSQGEIVSHIDAADLARQAIAVGDGALLRSRVSGNPSFAEAAFRALLASLLP